MDEPAGKERADGATVSVAGHADLAQLRGRTEDVPRGILL